MLPLLLSICAILVALSALFSITESAFLGVNKLKLEALKNQNNKRAILVAKLLANQDTLINTILVSNDLVNIALSAIFTIVAIRLFGKSSLAIATSVSTVVLLVFGEITPKTICVHSPDVIAYALAPFANTLVVMMRPIVFIFTKAASVALWFYKIDTAGKKGQYSLLDIKNYIDQASKSGALPHNEKSLIDCAFTFSDMRAQDIMVSIKDTVMFSKNTPIKTILQVASTTGYSYFPICKADFLAEEVPHSNMDATALPNKDTGQQDTVSSFQMAKILRQEENTPPQAKKIATTKMDMQQTPQTTNSTDHSPTLANDGTFWQNGEMALQKQDVVGILYLRDLLKISDTLQNGIIPRKVLRRPLFVSCNNKMSSVAEYLEKNNQSFALVTDDSQVVIGILTRKAIAAEVFG